MAIIDTFPILEIQPESETSQFFPTGTGGGFSAEFRGDIYTSRGRFGNGSAYIDISAVKSPLKVPELNSTSPLYLILQPREPLTKLLDFIETAEISI